LQVYRPAVLIVDLGLPDGSGLDLIAELQNARPRIGAILATSGDPAQSGAARSAGADGFLPKPLGSVASFQETVLGLLPADRQPMGPRRLPDEVLQPDPIAYGDDMAHALVLLGNTEAATTLEYALQFLASVAQNAQDTPLLDLCTKVQALRKARAPAASTQTALARLAAAVRERQDCRAAI
jgi:CheY-like chemotaxis protein